MNIEVIGGKSKVLEFIELSLPVSTKTNSITNRPKMSGMHLCMSGRCEKF